MRILPTPMPAYDQRWMNQNNGILQQELQRLDVVSDRLKLVEDVVGSADTGWTALTGTAQKGGGATYTAANITNPPTEAEVQAIADALQDAHRTIKALTDALIAHGLLTS